MSIDLAAHLAVTRGELTQSLVTDALNHTCNGPNRLIVEWFGTRLRHPPALPALWEPLPKPVGNADYSLRVPGGNCILSVMPKRALLFVGNKWSCIWWYPEFRDLLRRACFDLAQLLGSSMAIYAPEVVPVRGDTLDEVLASVRQERGDPASTFDALQDSDDDLYSAKGCYYIDTFDDIVEFATSG